LRELPAGANRQRRRDLFPREKALDYLPPERITLNPDCGFAPARRRRVSIDEVYQKLKNEVDAAQRLRDRYRSRRPPGSALETWADAFYESNSFSTTLHRFALEEAMRAIASAGLQGVGNPCRSTARVSGFIDDKLIDSVKRVLDETHLPVSNINANCSFGYWKDAPPEPYFEPSLISPNPQHRADRTRLILKTSTSRKQSTRETSASPAAACSAGCRPFPRRSNSPSR
jgi:hypothetical protein